MLRLGPRSRVFAHSVVPLTMGHQIQLWLDKEKSHCVVEQKSPTMFELNATLFTHLVIMPSWIQVRHSPRAFGHSTVPQFWDQIAQNFRKLL